METIWPSPPPPPPAPMGATAVCVCVCVCVILDTFVILIKIRFTCRRVIIRVIGEHPDDTQVHQSNVACRIPPEIWKIPRSCSYDFMSIKNNIESVKCTA